MTFNGYIMLKSWGFTPISWDVRATTMGTTTYFSLSAICLPTHLELEDERKQQQPSLRGKEIPYHSCAIHHACLAMSVNLLNVTSEL